MNDTSPKNNSKPLDPVWHREYWDRYVRKEKHFHQVIEYIRINPVKVGLVLRPGDWLWSIASGQSRDWRAQGDAL